MKFVVLGTMKYDARCSGHGVNEIDRKLKNSFFAILFLVLLSSFCLSQDTYKREHRIRKSQFPALSSDILNSVSGTKQHRYYKEINNSQAVYILKFKKARLNYFMEFNHEAQLRNLGFRIKEIDIPSETYSNIRSYLSRNFDKVRIRFLYQEYPVTEREAAEITIKNTFQNLLLPNNLYKLILVAKTGGKRNTYEAYFDSEGNFMRIRQSLPADYDHILY